MGSCPNSCYAVESSLQVIDQGLGVNKHLLRSKKMLYHEKNKRALMGNASCFRVNDIEYKVGYQRLIQFTERVKVRRLSNNRIVVHSRTRLMIMEINFRSFRHKTVFSLDMAIHKASALPNGNVLAVSDKEIFIIDPYDGQVVSRTRCLLTSYVDFFYNTFVLYGFVMCMSKHCRLYLKDLSMIEDNHKHSGASNGEDGDRDYSCFKMDSKLKFPDTITNIVTDVANQRLYVGMYHQMAVVDMQNWKKPRIIRVVKVEIQRYGVVGGELVALPIKRNEFIVYAKQLSSEFHLYSLDLGLKKTFQVVGNTTIRRIHHFGDSYENKVGVLCNKSIQIWDYETRQVVLVLKDWYRFPHSFNYLIYRTCGPYSWNDNSVAKKLANCQVANLFKFVFPKRKPLVVPKSILLQWKHFSDLFKFNSAVSQQNQCKFPNGDKWKIKVVISWLMGVRPEVPLFHDHTKLLEFVLRYPSLEELANWVIQNSPRNTPLGQLTRKKLGVKTLGFEYNRRLAFETHIQGLFLDESTANVLLEVDDGKFSCHREILSLRSEFFETMFSSKAPWEENDMDAIRLVNIDSGVFELVKKHLYMKNLELEEQPIDIVFKLNVIGDKMMISSLRQLSNTRMGDVKEFRTEQLIDYIRELHQTIQCK